MTLKKKIMDYKALLGTNHFHGKSAAARTWGAFPGSENREQHVQAAGARLVPELCRLAPVVGEPRGEPLSQRTDGSARPEEVGHCGKHPPFRRVPLKWRPCRRRFPRGLRLLGTPGARGARGGHRQRGAAGPPERAGLGAGGLGPAAPRGPRGQSRARMATPDQKSPNVLLQNLCCRILGKSEGSGLGRAARGPGRVLEAAPRGCSSEACRGLAGPGQGGPQAPRAGGSGAARGSAGQRGCSLPAGVPRGAGRRAGPGWAESPLPAL